MMTAELETTSASVMGAIRKSLVFVAVRKHRWTGQITLPKSVLHIAVGDDKEAVEDDEESRFVPVRVHLLPQEWDRRFSAVYSKIDDVLKRHTLPTDLGSMRVVSAGSTIAIDGQRRPVLDVIFDAIDNIETQLSNVVERLQDNYEVDVVQWNRQYWAPRLGSRYDEAIGRKIPSATALPSLFSIRRIAVSVDQVYDSAEIARDTLKAIHEKTAQEMEDFLWELAECPRKELLSAMEQARDRLENGVRLGKGTFSQLKNAIELVKSFGDFAGDKLLDDILRLEKELDDATRRVDNAGKGSFTDTIREAAPTLVAVMADVAKTVRDNAAAESIAERFGVRPRRLDLE